MDDINVIDTVSLFSQVLLIEDEDAHIALICRALDGLVGEIDIARNGKEAIEKIETSFPDLVFCDLRLPDASGLVILEALREARPGLPIIVMTSSSNLDDAISAMREGAWDYMTKDFSSSFVNNLQVVLQRAAHRKLQNISEFRLRAERNAYWIAVQHAPEGVGILGGEGYVMFANDAFKRFCLHAQRSTELKEPLQIVDVFASQDVLIANSLRDLLKVGGSGSLWTSELMVQDGEDKHVQQRFYEITLSSFSIENFPYGIFGNVSLPDNRKYVMWVRDVTRKKDQERFQRDLLSTTTHDLKGPLSAILTSAEILVESECRPVGVNPTDLAVRISSCARNCITLIDELLSARRIQDGVLIIRPQWMVVSELLEDIVLDFLPVARSKGIDFGSAVVGSDFEVYADKIAIHRVLGNLVNNAIKFCSKPGQVRLKAERVTGEVQITVSDTGSGIDPQERHQLFARFARLEKHAQIEGTGLGLFVAKNIVDAHGGRIELQSSVGKGTSFIITFPDPTDADDASRETHRKSRVHTVSKN